MMTSERYRCQCGRCASVYAIDPYPGGWGAYWCLNCKPVGWTVTDYVRWWE